MRRNWSRSLLCLWTAGAVLTSGCHPPPARTVATAATPPARAPSSATKSTGRAEVAIARDPSPDGELTATLAAATAVSTDAVVTALDAKATQGLLARMEPLPNVTTPAPPVIRPASQPPP